MRRNSAVAWLESPPRKPNPAGSVMPHRADATASDPAPSTVAPSRRAETVIVTGRVTPRSVSWPGNTAVTVRPPSNPAGSRTGPASVIVASGCAAVSRLVANCGLGLPPTVIAVRPMRNTALVTRPPAMTAVPLTAVVLPVTSLPKPRALSLMRNPATDPAATSQVPSADPAGALAAAEGSVSGIADGWDLTKIAVPPTTRTTRSPTPTSSHCHQRRGRPGPLTACHPLQEPRGTRGTSARRPRGPPPTRAG